MKLVVKVPTSQVTGTEHKRSLLDSLNKGLNGYLLTIEQRNLPAGTQIKMIDRDTLTTATAILVAITPHNAARKGRFDISIRDVRILPRFQDEHFSRGREGQTGVKLVDSLTD